MNFTIKMLFVSCCCVCNVFAVYCSGDNRNSSAGAEYQQANVVQHSEMIHNNVNDVLVKHIRGIVYDSDPQERDRTADVLPTKDGYKEANVVQHSEMIHNNVNDVLVKHIRGAVYDNEQELTTSIR